MDRKHAKAGAERLFPYLTTAANVNEAMRILMRARTQIGTKLTLSTVWDQVRAGYLTSNGTRVENVDEVINLLSDAKPVRVLMAQATAVRRPE